MMAVALTTSAKNSNDRYNFVPEEINVGRVQDHLAVSAEIALLPDSFRLGANSQIFITPVIEGVGDQRVVLGSTLINGRNMQYLYERGTLPKKLTGHYDLRQVLSYSNKNVMRFTIQDRTPMQSWMLDPQTRLVFYYETCGCGVGTGERNGPGIALNLNPAPLMRTAYLTPEVTELPTSVHEGNASVQFEVNSTVLHEQPYTTRTGRRIDNVEQLTIINDSVRYALADPNVEISRIEICGYASPESPYLHNESLATGRSRALAEYLAAKYNLPAGRAAYSSVPENWVGFRQMVESSSELTDSQRSDLLALIDEPAYGPSDYDAKEKVLSTDPRFSRLYRSVILPEWFPQLRTTRFAISTRLKPLSDQQLAQVILSTPQLLSLNQMFRVARLYPEGSPEFNRTIETALQYYPDSPVANLNAAIAALAAGDDARAAALLDKAGDSPEAENARGVLATRNGDFMSAMIHFDAAGKLPEAVKNKSLLND